MILANSNNFYGNELYEALKVCYRAREYCDRLVTYSKNRINGEVEKYKRTCDEFETSKYGEMDKKIEQLIQGYDEKIFEENENLTRFLKEDFSNDYVEQTLLIEQEKKPVSDDIVIPIGSCYIHMRKPIDYVSISKNDKKIEDIDIYKSLKEEHGNHIIDDLVRMGAVWYLHEANNIILHNIKNKMQIINIMNLIIFKKMKNVGAGNCILDVCCSSGKLDFLDQITNFCVEFPNVTSGKVITNKERINQLLDEYILEINDRIQNKIAKYGSIKEFNELNPLKKIKYKILYLIDLPYGFDEEMLNKLKLILEQGSRAGIQVIIITGKTSNEIQRNNDGTYINQLDQEYMKTINTDYTYEEINENWCINMKNRFIYLGLNENSVNYMDFISEFSKDYDRETKKILTLSDINNENYYQENSTYKLSIPIGINEYGEIQKFEVGDCVANGTSHYAIIVGATGSGKSSLLQTIIMSSAMNYSPDELELYLLDFKKGNEFKIYENYKIPHIKALALDTLQEFGESILNKLWDILEERNELFKNASKEGMEIKSISDYRKMGYKMPRILVIMDEVQVLFDNVQNRKVADRISNKMSNFISRARVYGIHFIFATQTMRKLKESTSLTTSTLDEMHIRIGLQCSEDDCELVFGAKNRTACMSKFEARKGSAVYLENDIVSNPVGMQVAYIDSEKQKEILKKIAEDFITYENNDIKIFRGNEVPEFEINQIDSEIAQLGKQKFIIGESLDLENKVEIEVSKKRRNNVLVVGDNQNIIDNISRIWLETAIKYNNTNKKSVYLLDGSLIIDEQSLMSTDYFKSMGNNIEVVDNVFRIIPVIDEIYKKYLERKNKMMNGMSSDEDKYIIHLVISNVQWIEPICRMLKIEDISDFETAKELDNSDNIMSNDFMQKMEEFKDSLMKNSNDKNIKTIDKFLKILESGYLCGIQTIITCSETMIAKNLFKLSNLPFFSNRIVLQMPEQDLRKFIDTDIKMQAANDNIALFSDERKAPFLFKPYNIQRK